MRPELDRVLWKPVKGAEREHKEKKREKKKWTRESRMPGIAKKSTTSRILTSKM